ncbi:hypothetical protein J1614_005080 [Plenodomus biglobosus]|nr:hypothetical protein J1614_005080 [Plenodomus biglobosus]
MLSQHHTSSHNTRQHDPLCKRQERHMPRPASPIRPLLARRLLFTRKIGQVLALASHPVCDVQFCGVEVALGCAVVAEQEEAGEGPVEGAGPVGEEDEEGDERDGVAGYAVVGVGEVDGGYGVCVAEGEEGGLG